MGSCKETISFFNESELHKRGSGGENNTGGNGGTYCCSPPNGSIQVNDEFDIVVDPKMKNLVVDPYAAHKMEIGSYGTQ